MPHSQRYQRMCQYAGHHHTNTIINVALTRAGNEGPRSFHNHGEGPYYCLLLVESAY